MIRDPGELDNLVAKEPERVRELDEVLVSFRVQAEARHAGNYETNYLTLEQDKELTERLRRLGYVE